MPSIMSLSFLSLCFLALLLVVSASPSPSSPHAKTSSFSRHAHSSSRVSPAAAPTLTLISSQRGTAERLAQRPDIVFTEHRDHYPVLSLYPDTKYQSILAFGGAITQAATVTWSKLPFTLQEQVVQLYYNQTHGHGYTWGRVPINSCDFSDHSYAYDNTPDDFDLSHFDKYLTEDSTSTIPFIKKAQGVIGSASGLRLFGTPWTPAPWMKGNGEFDHSSQPCLKADARYHKAWALYFEKWLDAMGTFGIPFWGLTIQNEPENDAIWEGCTYTAQEELDFYVNYLNPQLQQKYPHLNVMFMDHNKDHILEWANVFYSNESAYKSIWGLALHWYSGDSFENVEQIATAWPEKNLMATEACNCPIVQGYDPNETWRRAETYAHDIIGDLNAFVRGWTDWNILLDSTGGPNHVNNVCEAPLMADLTVKPPTLKINDIYYALGHFSRFLPEGSVRIAHQFENGTYPFEVGTFLVSLEQTGLSHTRRIAEEHSAITGDVATSQLVTILHNPSDNNSTFQFKAGRWYATVTVPAHSMHTAIFDASVFTS